MVIAHSAPQGVAYWGIWDQNDCYKEKEWTIIFDLSNILSYQAPPLDW